MEEKDAKELAKKFFGQVSANAIMDYMDAVEHYESQEELKAFMAGYKKSTENLLKAITDAADLINEDAVHNNTTLFVEALKGFEN